MRCPCAHNGITHWHHFICITSYASLTSLGELVGVEPLAQHHTTCRAPRGTRAGQSDCSPAEPAEVWCVGHWVVPRQLFLLAHTPSLRSQHHHTVACPRQPT